MLLCMEYNKNVFGKSKKNLFKVPTSQNFLLENCVACNNRRSLCTDILGTYINVNKNHIIVISLKYHKIIIYILRFPQNIKWI